MRIYTLFDRKVGEYGSLVISTTDESVLRALKDGIPPGSTEGKYPDDFELVYMGEYDPVTGTLEGTRSPRVIARLSAILKPSENGGT